MNDLRPPERSGAYGEAGPTEGLAKLMARTLEDSLDAIALTDGEGTIRVWNSAAERLFGYSAAEAVGRFASELIIPEHLRAAHEAGLARVARSGESETLRKRIGVPAQHRDGHEIPLEIALSALPCGDGFWFACTMRDVSERLRLEGELRASAERFRRIVEMISGMVYEFVLYPDGTMAFEYVSPGCEALYGIKAAELLGRRVQVGDLIHEEDREGFFASVARSAETLSLWRWEGRARTIDGAIRWIQGESRPVRREDGAIVWYGFVHDTTTEHEAHRKLEETRLFLSTTIDQMPDIVFLKDSVTGRFVLFNAAGDRFFGLERGEAIDRDASFLFGEATGGAISEFDRRVGQGTEMVEHEVPCTSPKGEPRLLVTRKVPIRAPGTGHPYVIGVATDVTEARARERELVETNAFLENRVRVRTAELRTTQREILARLGRAAGYRDDDTGRHIQRMSRTCAEIARVFGLPPAYCDLILQAAPMHDIGKIAVPDAILHKPARLTDEEMEVMRTHAEVGARMLAGGDSELILLAEEIALTHHERWDGTGYPRGLKGEEIPLAGRISAIADVFDALVSERPYKRAWTTEAALSEIERCAGTHFDPSLVAAFRRAVPAILASTVSLSEAA